MGQGLLCQPIPKGDPQASGCLHAKSAWLADCNASSVLPAKASSTDAGHYDSRCDGREVGGDSEASSSAGSEGEADGESRASTGKGSRNRPPSRLVLARQRVFSPHLQLKFKSAYKIERQIGEGSYGSVFEALALPATPSHKVTNGTYAEFHHGPHEVSVPAMTEYDVQRCGAPPNGRGQTRAARDGASSQGERLASNSTAASTAESASGSSSSKVRRVAVKCFRLVSKTTKDEDMSPRELERFHREVASRRASFERERQILAQLEHPHIVRMFECFEDRGALYIVMELCRGGELYVRIVQRARDTRQGGGGFEEPNARQFFRQMLFATSYLHAHRIVHRDIKTENFLLLDEGCSGDEGQLIKLCDFGTAVQLTDQQPRAMERIGTLSYTAPEIYAKEGADTTADAWSLGVVLYVLLVGASPFRTTGDEPREETVRRIRHGDFDKQRNVWRTLSLAATDLVNRFLVVDERKRLTSSDALRHRWVEPGTATPCQQSIPPELRGNGAPRRLLSPRSSRADSLANYAKYAPTLILLMTRFVHLHAMQQLALVVCAQMLPEADLLNRQLPIPWYDLFFALDADEDGRLNFTEFAAGLNFLMGSRCGVTQEQFQALVRALDIDCSGSIDWIEWVAVALLSVAPENLDPEPLSTAFRLLDRPSGDGRIGAVDLLAVINTTASGACLSATRGRRRVLKLLGRWAAPQASVTHAASPPSLCVEDFRRLLQSTARSGLGVDEASGQIGVVDGRLSLGLIAPSAPVDHHGQSNRTLSRNGGIDVRNFPWCRCQQPEVQVSGTEEIVKVDHVMVQQQSSVQSDTTALLTFRSAVDGVAIVPFQPPENDQLIGSSIHNEGGGSQAQQPSSSSPQHLPFATPPASPSGQSPVASRQASRQASRPVSRQASPKGSPRPVSQQ
eukprot:TRINITY_DN33697_c0_g1_i1.p1 TRINITY_DN33697_c0_g1~~TRINITY_DN33697_c0_g1_i1.p1  ORF type:complete len:908 (-),score=158.98 TRINITY_DN33697_c0_g1_i1:181-2904(-)